MRAVLFIPLKCHIINGIQLTDGDPSTLIINEDVLPQMVSRDESNGFTANKAKETIPSQKESVKLFGWKSQELLLPSVMAAS